MAPSDLPPPIRVSRSAVGWFTAYAGGFVKVNVNGGLVAGGWLRVAGNFKGGRRKAETNVMSPLQG